MKTVKALLLVILFASCTASKDEITTQDETCIKSYYTFEVVAYQGGTFVWDYVLQYSEPTTQIATDGYIRIQGENYYKIVCE